MIEIKKRCDFPELYTELWSGAVHTADTIIENGRIGAFMDLLEEIFYEPTDIMTINDFMWFEPDYIYEQLGLADLTDDSSFSK